MPDHPPTSAPTSTCWSSAPASPASTSCTAPARPASPCSCSRPAAASAAPGSGTATPARGSTPRATRTATCSPRSCSTSGSGRSTSPAKPETERYLNHVVDRFDLRRHMRFDAAGHRRPCTTSRRARGRSTARRRHRRSGPGSSIAATGVLSVPYIPDVPGRDDFRRRCSTTPVGGRPSRSTSPASGSRSSARRRAACRWSRRSSTTSPRSPCTSAPPTGARRSTTGRSRPRSRRSCGPTSRTLRETLNTSLSGFAHPVNTRAAFDDSADGAAGVLREDVEQPGLHEAHEQLLRPAVQRGRERRVVRVHRRQDPRHRARPRDRRAADPEGPSVRREAAAVRRPATSRRSTTRRCRSSISGRRRSCG